VIDAHLPSLDRLPQHRDAMQLRLLREGCVTPCRSVCARIEPHRMQHIGMQHPRPLRFVPILRGSFDSVSMPRGGTRQAEEVRDGSHANNRGGCDRCGVAPTAVALRPLDRARALQRSDPYTAPIGPRSSPHFCSSAAFALASLCPRPRLRGICAGATMTAPGARAQLRMRRIASPRARRTGFYHGVAAFNSPRAPAFALASLYPGSST